MLIASGATSVLVCDIERRDDIEMNDELQTENEHVYIGNEQQEHIEAEERRRHTVGCH